MKQFMAVSSWPKTGMTSATRHSLTLWESIKEQSVENES